VGQLLLIAPTTTCDKRGRLRADVHGGVPECPENAQGWEIIRACPCPDNSCPEMTIRSGHDG